MHMEEMYSWEKSRREARLKKNPTNPSFSSILLDEIYRSIDGGDEKYGELKVHRERMAKKQSNNGSFRGKTSSIEDEEMASFRRACLIEKWMEKKVNEKASVQRRSSMPEFDRKSSHDNDPLFFSSTSSSSDSSFGGFSSSETESSGATKSVTSCFAAPRPKPVKTSVSAKLGKTEHSVVYRQQQSEFYLFDDYHHQTNKTEEGQVKSKTRALYANLKKVKQPISPGGRLSNFINSLFTNGNAKKTKNSNSNRGYDDGSSVERQSKSTQASTCSSASSFSRSCLSKTSPKSREKLNNGIKRTVRFCPVSVIVDEDCRPCGQKSIYDEESKILGRMSARQANEEQYSKLHVMEQKNYKGRDVLKSHKNHKNNVFVARKIQDEDDVGSDSSSDLFELDHLTLFKSDRFCEELPVYETTHLDTNRAIASGLIR